jgi:hypothetical protein
MNKMIPLALLILVTSLLGACSSANINAIETPEITAASELIIFRPQGLDALLNDMIVSVDDDEIVVLKNKQYVSVFVPSGQHIVSVRGTAGFKSSLQINIEQSEVMYFEAAGSWNNTFNFIPGSVFIKKNFYIEKSQGFDSTKFTAAIVKYK